MSETAYQKLRATREDEAIKAMQRMRKHLGEWPTTTQWEEHRDELNITTHKSDVGQYDDLTFSQVRSLAGGSISNTPNKTHSDPLPLGVHMELTFDKDVDYDPESDSYIYVIKLICVDGDEYYYVGQTDYLYQRLEVHMRRGGDTKELDKDKKVNDIEIVDVDSYKRITESESKFTERVNRRERRKGFEVAAEYDTFNVLGAR